MSTVRRSDIKFRVPILCIKYGKYALCITEQIRKTKKYGVVDMLDQAARIELEMN